MAIIQSITVLRTGKGGRRGGVGLALTYKNTSQCGENFTYRKDMEKTGKIAKARGQGNIIWYTKCGEKDSRWKRKKGKVMLTYV